MEWGRSLNSGYKRTKKRSKKHVSEYITKLFQAMLKDAVTGVPTPHLAFYDDTTEAAHPSGTYKTRHALYRSTLRAISEEKYLSHLSLNTKWA